jgi:hypothetical protein
MHAVGDPPIHGDRTMKTLATLALAGAAAFLSTTAFASAKCTDAPRDKWMPLAQLKAQLLKDGYTIDKFKVSGTCYEIYGQDKAGKAVEIYFDPTDGRLVKRRARDED